MSQQYFKDLYEWLQEAYESAMQLGQPQLAMQFVAQMRAMEVAGVVQFEEKDTVH